MFNATVPNKEGTGYVISNGGRTLTLYLVDGKDGDDDLLANEIIIDPANPLINASSSLPVPTPTQPKPIPVNSRTGLLLLMLMLSFYHFKRVEGKGL